MHDKRIDRFFTSVEHVRPAPEKHSRRIDPARKSGEILVDNILDIHAIWRVRLSFPEEIRKVASRRFSKWFPRRDLDAEDAFQAAAGEIIAELALDEGRRRHLTRPERSLEARERLIPRSDRERWRSGSWRR
ncbi:MAG: hypothetical protein U5R48_18925 [Gammaproteobacteria bacterium]|nr:hypothetical protein [Gammaproteobacteria bacterium]